MKIAIVVSQFNKDICDRLEDGARKALEENGVQLEVFKVPGAFEIPYMCQKIIDAKKFSGIVALGCVLRGETDHYKAVCDGVTYGLQKVSIENKFPVMFGVLMCETRKDAAARSSKNQKDNKGYECAKELLSLGHTEKVL
ncbi:MAG: 6,7-dimethyl-8-ribityllumazine synthase [Patescibacteria group bacterium]